MNPHTTHPAPAGAAPSPRRSRRPLQVAAALLLTGGAAVLGWVAWQVWGTNAVAERRHDEVVQQLDDAWADPGERSGGRAGTDVEAVATDYGNAVAVVRIPAFGDDYAVPVFEGTSDEVLASGFGHRDGTAAAGEKGNYVIAGHRITHGEPLRRMPELDAGDEVIVETRTATYTYVLDTAGDGLTVTDQDTWVVEPDPSRHVGAATVGISDAPRLLTLITCADFTHSPDRLVAFGHLVDQQKRTNT